MNTLQTVAPRPRIPIADDHVMFAEAMSYYLNKLFTVVGVIADGRTLVEGASSSQR